MESLSTTIRQFHLGVSEDGQRCRLAFSDEDKNVVEWIAEFNEFSAFVSTLCNAAAEMVRRQTPDGSAQRPLPYGPLEVSSAAFKVHPTDGSIMGAIVSQAGDVVGLRMRPEVACQLSRDLLLAAPAVSAS
jgi:hypothetical protein